MNELSVSHIKRYFAYAGHVEDVKKLDESAIVVIIFSYRNSSITLMQQMPISSMGGWLVSHP